jgi:hypothetical protein
MGLLALLVQAVGMIVYHKSPTISNASIGCLTLLMLGATFMMISAVTWALVQTPALCALKYSLLCVGLQFILGALFMRTYRIGWYHLSSLSISSHSLIYCVC